MAAPALASSRRLNVSVVPPTSAPRRSAGPFGRTASGRPEERRCDKFIRNRAYDKTCQQMDPKPYELLPLPVTGAPGSGTRAVFELVTRCATRPRGNVHIRNLTLVPTQRPAVPRRLHAIDARASIDEVVGVFFSILSRFDRVGRRGA